jgi:hypothetical protein
MNAQKTLAALNAALDLTLSGALSEEGIVDVSGTFTATLVVEGTADGSTYRALAMSPVAGGADVASVTAPGAWRVNFAGCKSARVRVSAYTSGSAVVAAQVAKKAA